MCDPFCHSKRFKGRWRPTLASFHAACIALHSRLLLIRLLNGLLNRLPCVLTIEPLARLHTGSWPRSAIVANVCRTRYNHGAMGRCSTAGMCTRRAVYDWGYDNNTANDATQLVKHWPVRPVDNTDATRSTPGTYQATTASWRRCHLDPRLGRTQQLVRGQHFEADRR